MKVKRNVLVGMAAALLLAFAAVPAFADVPDATRTGSLSVTMTYEKEPVTGGDVTLYRVGEVAEDNGSYQFVLTGDFASSGVALDDVQSSDIAKALASYAEEQELSGTEQQVDAAAHVRFGNLQTGLYLVVQREAAPGYYPADPFLVSIPLNQGGTYVYDVDASPKLELEKAPTPPVTTTSIPETGENVAPMVLCGIGGLVLCVGGCALYFSRKAKQDAQA